MATDEEAARIARLTYRQLDYWCRTNLIQRPADGDWTFEDLRQLREVRALVDTGMSLKKIREMRGDG